MSDWKPEDDLPDMPDFMAAAKRAYKEMKSAMAEMTKEPAHIYEVPDQYVEHLLELVQARDDWSEDHRRPSLKCHMAIWRYVNGFLPAAQDYACHIDLSHMTKPKIRLRELYSPPREGINGVTKSFVIDGANFDKIIEFVDAGTGPLYMYRLWSFINKLHPETADNENWTLWNGHNAAVVYKKAED